MNTLHSARHTTLAVFRKGAKDVAITYVLAKDLWGIATSPDQMERYRGIILAVKTLALVTLGFVLIQIERISTWADHQVAIAQSAMPHPTPDPIPDPGTHPLAKPASPFTGAARAYELLSRAELLRLCRDRRIAVNKDSKARLIHKLVRWDKTRDGYWKKLE